MAKETVQKWLMQAINDPITKLLTKNSNLTKTQLETLLIDFLASNLSDKSVRNDEKARLRLSKAEISRGAFNRTLKQARENVIQSMYTIILLGYLGLFENTRLAPYLEAADRLQHYVNAYKDALSNGSVAEEQLRVVNMLRAELENVLQSLSGTRNLS